MTQNLNRNLQTVQEALSVLNSDGKLQVVKKRGKKIYSNWSIQNNENLLNLGKLRLGIGAQVAIMLMGYCDYNNLVSVNLTHLATEMGVSLSTVNKSIKKLIDCGFISRIESSQLNTRGYMINPIYIYKGSSENYSTILDIFLSL